MGFMDKLVSGKELIGVKKRRSQSYIFEKFEYELQEKRESEGWIVDKELKSMVRMKRPKPLDRQFEDDVWCLFSNLGFSYMNKDRRLEIPYGTEDLNTSKQIDVFAADEETVLFIECKCAFSGKKGDFKTDLEAIKGIKEGLFYGGGFEQLGLQLIGFASVAAWTAVTITIAFLAIKATVGLRVSEEEEIVGLDATEHGLPSAYAGFSIMDISNTMTMDVNENTDLGVESFDAASDAMKNAAVKVVKMPVTETGMYKVSIIAKLSRYDRLKKAMNDIGVTGMTVTQVMGCGVQKGAGEKYRGVEMDATLLPKVKVEVIVGNIPVDKVVDAAKKALYTGHIGDGKIFVYNVDKVIKVRTGEEDLAALADVE